MATVGLLNRQMPHRVRLDGWGWVVMPAFPPWADMCTSIMAEMALIIGKANLRGGCAAVSVWERHPPAQAELGRGTPSVRAAPRLMIGKTNCAADGCGNECKNRPGAAPWKLPNGDVAAVMRRGAVGWNVGIWFAWRAAGCLLEGNSESE
jgi:hypothetical protein